MRVYGRIFLRPVAIAALLATAAASSGWAQDAPKVGVINVVQLLEESDAGKRGIEDLKALQKAKTEELDARQVAIKDLRSQIEEGKFSLAEKKLADLQRELESSLIELQRSSDDATRELQKRQADMLEDIQQLIMPVISAVGAEFGYTMIFNKFESGLIYASEAIDITQLVMERLNNAVEPQATPGS